MTVCTRSALAANLVHLPSLLIVLFCHSEFTNSSSVTAATKCYLAVFKNQMQCWFAPELKPSQTSLQNQLDTGTDCTGSAYMAVTPGHGPMS